MKIRTGFVSNSSSSSFIVAAPPQKDSTKVTITIEVDLAEYANTTIKTVEELIEYFKEHQLSVGATLDSIKN